MAKKRVSSGARALLFDRLCDYSLYEAEEPDPFIYYTSDELKASIQHEVSNLLNTRCVISKETYKELGLSVYSFGIPEKFGLDDFSFFDATNTGDWFEINEIITKTVAHFEPRLSNVQVTIQKFDKKEQSLFATLKGDIKIGYITEPIVFPVAVHAFDASHKTHPLPSDSQGRQP